MTNVSSLLESSIYPLEKLKEVTKTSVSQDKIPKIIKENFKNRFSHGSSSIPIFSVEQSRDIIKTFAPIDDLVHKIAMNILKPENSKTRLCISSQNSINITEKLREPPITYDYFPDYTKLFLMIDDRQLEVTKTSVSQDKIPKIIKENFKNKFSHGSSSIPIFSVEQSRDIIQTFVPIDDLAHKIAMNILKPENSKTRLCISSKNSRNITENLREPPITYDYFPDYTKLFLMIDDGQLKESQSLQKDAREDIRKGCFHAIIDKDGNLSIVSKGESTKPTGEKLSLSDINEEWVQTLKPPQFSQLLIDSIIRIPSLAVYLFSLLKKPGEFKNRFEVFLIKTFESNINLMSKLTTCYEINIFHTTLVLFSYGFPFTDDFFIRCLMSQNLPLIKISCRNINLSWLEQHSKKILSIFMCTFNPIIGELFLEYFPNIGHMCPLSLLEESLEQGNDEFFCFIIKHGKKIPSRDFPRLIKKSLSVNNLRLIQTLCEQAQKKSKKESLFYTLYSYPEILELEKLSGIEHRQDRYKQLFSYALNSPMETVYRLVQKFPEFCDVLPEVITKISLLVRLPKCARSTVVSEEWETYYKLSEEYAAGNINFINHVVPKLQSMTRDQLMDAIIENRFFRYPDLSPNYKIKMATLPHSRSSTPLITKSEKGKENFNFTRYYPSLRHLTKLACDSSTKLWRNIDLLSMGIFEGLPCISFDYPLPSSSSMGKIEKVTLTRLEFNSGEIRWIHAFPESILKIKPHGDQLYRELVEEKVNTKSS